jgi:hypothetical protein
MKISAVGTELFHADGRTDEQTDMTKIMVVFRNFVKAPEDCHRIRTVDHMMTEVHTRGETSCLSPTPKTRENIQSQ